MEELNPRNRWAKRCWCTGETPNMVRRRRKQFGTSDELVPTAPNDGQSVLEAELLLAINRTTAVNRVRLDAPVLALEIDEQAVDSLLANALPQHVGNELVGIPGLRPTPGRDHLDLRLESESRVEGEVRLLGVTRQRWRYAVGRLPGAVAWHSKWHGVAAYPARLMSGVLRRLPLWRKAAWVEVVPSRRTVDVYWRGGPASWSIAEILGGSCAGMSGVAATAPGLNAVRGVSLAVHETSPSEEPEQAWRDWLHAASPAKEIAVRSSVTSPERQRFLRRAAAITVRAISA